MSTTTAERKEALRREIRNLLTAMPEDVRRTEDDVLFSRFLSLPELDWAQTIFLFYGVGAEPETARLIPLLSARGKRVVLPRMLPKRQMEVRLFCPDRPLVKHPFGIPEPDEGCPLVDIGEIDLVLVPALCYDQQGIRLGMGGGYYDRWLPLYSGPTVGLCREDLFQKELPAQPHDRPVDIVITPTRTVRIK